MTGLEIQFHHFSTVIFLSLEVSTETLAIQAQYSALLQAEQVEFVLFDFKFMK
jgi:hypothetical protein